MARKFIDLEEAAEMLGVTPETLSEMRDRQKVHGYRDGGSWKFKPEEIERVIAERETAEQEGEFAEVDEDPDSILLSEVELGDSDDSASSTIIGGSASRNPSESDIQIAPPKQDSDLDLDSALSGDAAGGSDVLGGSDVVPGSGVSPTFDELDTLDLDLPSAADSGISSKIFSDITAPTEGGSKASSGGSPSGMSTPEGSGLAFGSEDELTLDEAPSDEDQSQEVIAAESDDDDLLLDVDDGGSAIDLTGDDDGDLVLGGGSGDLSRTGDSGISLMDPADSGLSLESAPLELGGSAVESLELGEDDMILTEDEAAEAEEEAAADEQSDDDFLLTPLEESAEDESDSGSQVIALDEDVEFEDASADVATEEPVGDLLAGDFEEGLDSAAGGLDEGLGVAPSSAPATATAGAAAPAAAPAAPFSGWSVAGLALCSVLLVLTGMFMFDLMRNMWSWQGPYTANSSMMDMVLSWFE